MVFLELHLRNVDQVEEDFKLFLSSLKKVYPVDQYTNLQINSDLLVGITSNGKTTPAQLDACFKYSNSILENFKKTIRGKYPKKVVKELKFTTNLYVPVEKGQFFKIKGKTAIAILPFIEKLPFEARSYAGPHNKVYIVIKSGQNQTRIVSGLKNVIFFNSKKTTGINIEEDLELLDGGQK